MEGNPLEKLTLYLLLTVDELRRFAMEYEDRVFKQAGTNAKPTPDLAYLANTLVYGAFTADGKMVGGLVLNRCAPMRYVDILSQPVADALFAENGLTRSDIVELTYLWLGREATQFQRLMLLHDAMWLAFRTGKKWLMAGTYARAIAKNQMITLRRMLYVGPGTLFGRKRRFWVYYESRYRALGYLYWRILKALLKGRIGIDNASR